MDEQKQIDTILFSDYLLSFPDWELFIALSILMGIDFATGFVKAKFFNINRTSTALKRTVTKITQYFTALIVVWFMSNLVQIDMSSEINWFSKYIWWFQNGVVILMCYIELISILENSIAIDKDSNLARLLTKPLHKILTIQTKNNPFYTLSKDQQYQVELKKIGQKDYRKFIKKDSNTEVTN